MTPLQQKLDSYLDNAMLNKSNSDQEVATLTVLEEMQNHQNFAGKGSKEKKARAGYKWVMLENVGPVLLERSKRAQRLNLSVRPSKELGGPSFVVRVAVPARESFGRAEAFAMANSDWVEKQINRWKAQEERYHDLVAELGQTPKEQVKKALKARLEVLGALHGYDYGRVTIRNQKTRWGSCSSKRNISLNIRLALLPDELRDYVMLHELIHTKHPNHGKGFWWELERVCPGAKELRQQLKDWQFALMFD